MDTQKALLSLSVVAVFLNCTLLHASAAWQIETVPCSMTPGEATMALDAADRPHIAIRGYGESSPDYVLYSHKVESGWQEETVSAWDTYGSNTRNPLLKINSLDYPHIFYNRFVYTGGQSYGYFVYEISRKSDSVWSHSSVSSYDTSISPYQSYAFALDSNNDEHSFREDLVFYPSDLKISYDYETLVAGSWLGTYDNQLACDLVMDSLDYPHIAYRGSIQLPLTYLYKDGLGWHSETIDSAGSTADYLSLALDSNDRPHVSYYDNVNGDLKYAYRDETGWHLETVDSIGDVGRINSIGVDSQDIPHISYYDATNEDLKYARRDELGWHIETVDSAGNVGYFSCLDMDSLDRPHILYRDATNSVLKYAVYAPGCENDSDCREGYQCVDRICVPILDDPPALGDGPFVAAGAWPPLSSSQESPTVFKQNYSVLWTFSDDFASCSEDCTHTAEYQVLGGDTWIPVAVSSDAAQGYAWADLPITGLQNATTYAFRFTVTDCASQSTQSNTYYFRVATSDAPPVITGGPWLAAGWWPRLPTLEAQAFVLSENYDVYWSFSDDYATCSGLVTHRARYRKVGDMEWTWVTPATDPTGTEYAYTTLPVESLENGTYQFQFDVRDCSGQYTFPPHFYYFTVDR